MAPLGIVNINKPAGRTSREVVDCVERLTRPTRAGHAGTLDPLATGVLVVCVGRATRLIQYIQRMPKLYWATFLLGRGSETDDVEGVEQVEIASAPQPSRQMLESVLPRFVGPIEQRPPDYSAIKVGGRRAYELARRGQSVVLAPRTVMIHRLGVRRYEYPDLEMEIECGSGTYVRALGRDVAAALGTAAVMSVLERRAIGQFRIENSLALDELTAEALAQHLEPAVVGVGELPRVELSGPQQAEIRHGRPIALPSKVFGAACASPAGVGAAEDDEYAAVDPAGALLAILRRRPDGRLWPKANFL